MVTVIPVSADWLTLREDADAAARSLTMARDAAGRLRGPVIVHDLGSGTGSMMRWLAPLLPGPQRWVLHDWNPALMERAARARPREVADVQMRVGSLEHLRRQDLDGASLVVASALLDVLTAHEVQTIVQACVAARAPALFTLTVTGRVSFEPLDPADGVFEAAFNDHQRRVTHGRRLLGPDAVSVLLDLFRAARWETRVEESPWRLGASGGALLAEWMDGWLGAAVDERPALREWAVEYARTRSAQLGAGTLRVDVHHQDVLAWPP